MLENVRIETSALNANERLSYQFQTNYDSLYCV